MARRKIQKKSKKVKSLSPELYVDFWPQERDVMMRPERLRYVRKLIKPKGCVFCEAGKGPSTFDTLLLYKTEKAMVVLNKYPYNNGHLMVLPIRHEGEFLKLKKEEHVEIQELLRLAIQVVTETYAPNGFNVGLNLGSAAGAGIPDHLHYHVVPRWLGDTNFFPLIAETKVVVENLEQTYDRLLMAFQKHKGTK